MTFGSSIEYRVSVRGRFLFRGFGIVRVGIIGVRFLRIFAWFFGGVGGLLSEFVSGRCF